MKKTISIFAFLVLCYAPNTVTAQNTASALLGVIKKVIPVIEKEDRIVEKTIIDILYKDRDTKFSTEYSFYAKETYKLMVIGQNDALSRADLAIYRYDGSSKRWILEKKTNKDAVILSLTFEPTESTTYKIEVVGNLTGENKYAIFGLIIDREM